ncbi:FAD:protein FMN transferase [Flavobacterium degerlachei]|jgi:thiamine biosynthesis lipoprotein|uniref:FAD:protein FMN transferase n=1 Tax=Flavobacterium degerlachei TaxID=229203 RepID=A0A1H2U1F8_9FLAO|nr:FAD:protein FMN transferase [Flavobacterium degerlachei]SDW50053.1 thiamine biosynthesis lipoprotein [Flavobacterium degerlachei]
MRQLSLILFLFASVAVTAQVTQKRTLSMLGSPFEMIVEAKDIPQADIYIDMAVAEVSRVENLISDWIPTTPISEVNRNAGVKPVKVPQEVFDLVQRSIKISELTSGAFDISYASMDKIWKFDGSMTKMPSPEEIKKSVEKVGYKNIILDAKNFTIFLKNPGMKLGLGGIGQGFIADKIKALLVSKGVVAGIVNISGDINTWGKQLNGEKWKVGIKNPLNKDKIFATFPLEDSAVETSGSYEKYVTFNGIRYSHIIDTRTGYPASGVISVTVFAKSTEFADALATGVFVMGVDVGLDLVNQLPGIGCIYVDDKGKIFASKNIDLKKFKNE